MRITFHGAARQVTGSCHLLEVGSRRILLDCGLFDADRLKADSPNRRFDFDPAGLDAVVISHAHNDHIGRLACLTKAGYRGPMFATRGTGDIINIMLRDSARIQQEDAKNIAWTDDGEPVTPLFGQEDVDQVVESLRRIPYGEATEILDGVSLTFHDAGHVLGSALVQIDARESGKDRRFVFTGDLGRRDSGLLPDPTVIKDIDVLVSETTYGAKELDSYQVLLKKLHAIIARATRLRSKIVIPAFSLGRTQRMVYCLQELFQVHKVKPIPVYVDSPLALRLTDVHRDHPEAYTPAAKRLMESGPMLFASDHITFCATWDDSKRLNYMNGPMIIIASSGMCEAGRVRHHLRHVVEDPDNAVVIVSYQAEGTLGRRLVDGVDEVEIMDRRLELNAAVYVLDGFSSHADKNDLAWWYEQTGGGISSAFLVHGDLDAMTAIAPALQPHVNSPVVIPELGSSHEV